jgi:signal transduction histidine kinase
MGSDELRVVLTNLLENAIQASEDGSEVQVKVDKIAQDCLISVADHGCGIAEEALQHIFERFFRSDPSRSRESGGNGLGLAITQAIVQRAGGSIEASSALGVGSVFVVRLPGVV